MIRIIEYVNGLHESGYKYLLRQGASNWQAFRTESGYNNWLQVIGLEVEKTEEKKGGHTLKHGEIVYDEKLIIKFHTLQLSQFVRLYTSFF